MKKIFILITLLTLSSVTFAQTDDDKKKEKKYRWGCAVAINSVEAQFGKAGEATWGFNGLYGTKEKDKSFSLSIIPSYFIKQNLLIRFEFGLTSIHFTTHLNSKSNMPQSPEYYIKNTINEQKIYRYIPGIQWNFFRTKRIETYCGLNVPYVLYGKEKYNSIDEIRNLVTDTINYSVNINATAPGGFSLGGGFLTGTNIYLYKNISLGAELTFALQYYSIGGDHTGTIISQSPPNQATTSELKEVGYSYAGITFSRILPSLTLKYYFN